MPVHPTSADAAAATAAAAAEAVLDEGRDRGECTVRGCKCRGFRVPVGAFSETAPSAKRTSTLVDSVRRRAFPPPERERHETVPRSRPPRCAFCHHSMAGHNSVSLRRAVIKGHGAEQNASQMMTQLEAEAEARRLAELGDDNSAPYLIDIGDFMTVRRRIAQRQRGRGGDRAVELERRRLREAQLRAEDPTLHREVEHAPVAGVDMADQEAPAAVIHPAVLDRFADSDGRIPGEMGRRAGRPAVEAVPGKDPEAQNAGGGDAKAADPNAQVDDAQGGLILSRRELMQPDARCGPLEAAEDMFGLSGRYKAAKQSPAQSTRGRGAQRRERRRRERARKERLAEATGTSRKQPTIFELTRQRRKPSRAEPSTPKPLAQRGTARTEGGSLLLSPEESKRIVRRRAAAVAARERAEAQKKAARRRALIRGKASVAGQSARRMAGALKALTGAPEAKAEEDEAEAKAKLQLAQQLSILAPGGVEAAVAKAKAEADRKREEEERKRNPRGATKAADAPDRPAARSVDEAIAADVDDGDDAERHVEQFWSPVDEYHGKSARAQAYSTRFSRITETKAPSFTMGEQLPIKERESVAPPPNAYDTSNLEALSGYRSAPAARVLPRRSTAEDRSPPRPGVGEYDIVGKLGEGAPAARIVGRPPTRDEIERKLGYPVPPAPGGDVPAETFSFALQDTKQRKGVVFGHRLPDRREIEEKLGIGQGPAPGDFPAEAFSFTAQDKKENKGVVFGHRLPDRYEIDKKLGIFHGPAPGGDIPMDVFSFAAQDKKLNKGVVFGSRLDLAKRVVNPEPGPGAFYPELYGAIGSAPGGIMGGTLARREEIDEYIGATDYSAPGDVPYETFSFTAQNAKAAKGVVFGHRLPDRREIDEKLGIFHGPAPGGDIPSEVFSFAAQGAKLKKGASFSGRLPDRRDIDAKLGIGHGPAPGGDIPMEVFSFAAQDAKQRKGVVFGSKLPDRREIEEKLGIRHGPAPGDLPLESFSFASQDAKQGKGVVFGHRLPDRQEIDEKLGYFHGPAPGGDIPLEVFSFTAQNAKYGKGVVMGTRVKGEAERASNVDRRRGDAAWRSKLQAVVELRRRGEARKKKKRMGFPSVRAMSAPAGKKREKPPRPAASQIKGVRFAGTSH